MARKHNPFNFSNIKNFRLVAPTSLTGNKIQLYRTANFSNIHEADLNKLEKEIGLKTYIDLRSNTSYWEKNEMEKLVEKLAPRNIQYVNVAVATDLQPLDSSKFPEVKAYGKTNARYDRYNDPTRHADFLAKYMVFVCKYNGHLIREVLHTMSIPSNYPLVFGCHAGKDRTGLIAALVLSLCGLNKQDIMDDYILSNEGWGEMDSNTKTSSVYPESLNAVFEWIESNHGSVNNYCNSIGITNAEIQNIVKICTHSDVINGLPLAKL